MAPKRTRKAVNVPKINDYKNLSLNSVLCPVCRSILIEPVSLPCNHGFCLSCFQGTIANTNLVCPLCRIRIGSWLRNVEKRKKLVNVEFWAAIKKTFPQQVQNKLDGIDENFEGEEVSIKLAPPGEIRREYELERFKEEQEIKKRQEAEAKASEELIKQLSQEEEYRKMLEEEKIKLDKQVAKQLAKDLSNLPGPSKVSKKQGPLDRFLKIKSQNICVPQNLAKTILSNKSEFSIKILNQGEKKHLQIQRIMTEADASDSSDSIESECHYFKPIEHKNIPRTKPLSPIKIPTKLASSPTIIIGAPNGTIKFKHSMTNSAFIPVKLPLMLFTHKQQTNSDIMDSRKITESSNANNAVFTGRRTRSMVRHNSTHVTIGPYNTRQKNEEENEEVLTKGLNNLHRKRSKEGSFEIPTDIVTSAVKRVRKERENGKRIVPLLRRRSSKLESKSPPFYGFEKQEINYNYDSHLLKNGDTTCSAELFCDTADESKVMKKIKQEQEDLEFAKKLHEDLNRSTSGRYSTRFSIMENKRKSRQITLDELMKPSFKVNI